MHSSRIFSSFQEIVAGERVACLLDQASIAKVAKIDIRRSAPEPSAPGPEVFGFAQGGNRQDASHAVADDP